MSPGICRMCGAEEADHTPLIRLLPVAELGRSVPVGAVRLCKVCIESREARRWSIGGATGQRLASTLATRRHTPSRKFSYLSDEAEWVRLVRVRPDWIQGAKKRGSRALRGE